MKKLFGLILFVLSSFAMAENSFQCVVKDFGTVTMAEIKLDKTNLKEIVSYESDISDTEIKKREINFSLTNDNLKLTGRVKIKSKLNGKSRISEELSTTLNISEENFVKVFLDTATIICNQAEEN